MPERDAVAGKAFFLASEDPMRFRVDLYIAETLPPELQQDFQALGGSFLLDLPSGRLVVAGYNSTEATAGEPPIAMPNGAYVLTLMGRRAFVPRPRTGDGGVGRDADCNCANEPMLSFLRCCPLSSRSSLSGRFDKGNAGFFYFALPLFVLAWAPHVLLRNSKRYQRIERLMKEHEAAKPHFILKLAPTERTHGLSGGFVNV